MYKWVHKLFGEYLIYIQTENPLPFLKMLTDRNILFWGFRKEKEHWVLHTSLSNAELLLSLAKEKEIPISNIKKTGLPFLLAKYKKRPGLLVGMLFGLALIFFSELFVWKVEIHGNTILSDEEIIAALEDYGIGIGSFIPDIPVLRAQNEFLIQYKDLSSFAINIKGTHLEIELLERTHAPEMIDESGICNIIASEDAIIVSVEVAAGTAMVAPGDVVEKGQLLISACTVNDRNIYLMRHARGKIIAHTYENYSVCIPLQRNYKEYTGKKVTKTVYSVFGKEIPLYLREFPNYERFDATKETEKVYLFGVAELPVQKTNVTYREYRVRQKSISVVEAKEEAENACRQWLNQKPEKVFSISRKGGYDEIQNAYVLNVSVVLEKEIGLESPASPLEIPQDAEN